MNAHLQSAIDALTIRDVYLRQMKCDCSDGFDPKYTDPNSLQVQFMHLVTKSEIVKLEDEDGLMLLRVYIVLGARWVSAISENPDEDVSAIIEAEFIAEYEMANELEEAAINEFCLKNASYHVWPYGRELIMNQSVRMQLPKCMLPTMQLAHNRHQESPEK